MRIAFIAAGAAGMYCGSCMHDNTLASSLMDMGHDVALIPTYTPMRTDEVDVSMDRVFYGAVNVYIEQLFPGFRRAPAAVHRLLDRKGLLKWISRFAGSTDARELGALTLSILQGEEGRQRRELEELVDWLVEFQPDAVHLTNSMFLGMARSIRERLPVPVICGLPGEDLFLGDLVEPFRTRVRHELRRRANDVDGFIAPNGYFAGVMAKLLSVSPERIHVVPLGVHLDEVESEPSQGEADERPFTIGYLARICPEKGLHLLVEAFQNLAADAAPGEVRLVVAGYLAKSNEEYLEGLQKQIDDLGLGDSVEWRGEVDRDGKRRLLTEVDVLSVPTTYQESKGLYVLEAMAAGVPVVQPAHGAFPEMIEATGGGLLVRPGDLEEMTRALAKLARDPGLRQKLAERGRAAVRDRFGAREMARSTLRILEDLQKPGSAK